MNQEKGKIFLYGSVYGGQGSKYCFAAARQWTWLTLTPGANTSVPSIESHKHLLVKYRLQLRADIACRVAWPRRSHSGRRAAHCHP